MVSYNPKQHHRRSVRLPGYDYSQPGAYFVTFDVQGGHCLLGDVVDGQVCLSEIGQIADAFWDRVPERYPHVSIDARIVMPNHVHAIIVIHNPDLDRRGAVLAPSDGTTPEGGTAPEGGITPPLQEERPTLGDIVAYYKYETTVLINDRCGYEPGRFWQRSFYDKILPNRRALEAIRQYIVDNPPNWALDRDHPDNVPGTHRGQSHVH